MKVAIYARYSSDNQRQESIDAQLRYLKEFAKDNNYQIMKTYIDKALSATSDDRPQFLEMIKDSKVGLFEGVLVHKLDRFARNRYDSAFYRKELKRYGVSLISALEKFDDSPESIILESVIEGMNEYYSANLSREVKKGMKENALVCKHNGGIPPLGYDLDNEKKYVLNEYEATIVKKIFKLYLDGFGYGKILEELKGCKSKRDNAFSKRSIESILRNEKYTGVYIFNKNIRKTINGKKVDVPNKNVIKVEGGVPQIISKEDFQKVVRKLEQNRKDFRSYNTKVDYLLSGMIFCACGSHMVGNSKYAGRDKTLYTSYECSARKRKKTCTQKAIGKDYVENLIIAHIKKEIPQDADNLTERLYSHLKKTRTSLNEQIRAAERELKKVQKEIDNIINAITMGMFHESMKDKMTDLETKKNELILFIGESKTKIDKFISKEIIKRHLLSCKAIDTMPFNSQRKMIKSFVRKITIHEKEVKIDLIVDVDNGGEGN